MLDTHLSFSEPTLVTTLPGGQNGLSFPLAPVYEASQLKLVRASLHLQALSAGANNIVVEVRVQVSADATSWPTSTTTPTALPTPVVQSAEGFNYGTTWDDVSGLATMRYFRFVLWVKNGAGITGLGTCLASMCIERRSC